MKGLFGYNVDDDKSPQKKLPWSDKHLNPMVKSFGPAEDSSLRCRDCRHLYVKEFAKRYYKCELRGDSNGPATDHRKHWPACSKIEKW